MSTRKKLSARSISVEMVPTEMKDELGRRIAQHTDLFDIDIQVEEQPGFHTERGISRFRFLLDAEETVEVVLSKRPIKMAKVILEVETYEAPSVVSPQRVVQVSGLPKSVSRDFLELYFENKKRSGGDTLVDLKYDDGEEEAFLTYETDEVARRVLARSHILHGAELAVCLQTQTPPRTQTYDQIGGKKEVVKRIVERGQHKIGNETIVIPLHEPKDKIRRHSHSDEEESQLCTVKVSGISKVESMETLQLYFENSRRSGGGTLVEFEVYKEDDIAFLTFEEEQVAHRVVERGQHQLAGTTVEVSLYEPVRGQRKNAKVDGEEEDKAPLCSIKVKGISRVHCLDTLEYYFENTRRSGGGTVIKFETHEEEDFAYVTFEEETVAKRVASRSHKLNEVDLNVSLYKPPKPRPFYTNRLIIKGVNPSTPKDCLFIFLEAKSGASPSQLVYGEQEGTMMVTFDSDPDFEKLEETCRKRRLENSTIGVYKVAMSNCVIISNLKPSTSTESVQFYFENIRRSNGGEIEKVQRLDDGVSCLVFFQDYTVVDDVLKKSHVLEGERLTVQIYIENLGRIRVDDSKPRLKIPDDIIVDDINDKIVEFIKKSEDCKEVVNKQLEGCYARVLWPEKGSSFIIQCAVTVSMPDYRKLVKDWKMKVERTLKDYLNQLSLKEIPVWDGGWDRVLKALLETSIENPNAVTLYVKQDKKVIIVVGYKHTVEAVSIMIEKVIKTIGDDIERQKQKAK